MLATLENQQKNQNDEHQNSDLISRGQFENWQQSPTKFMNWVYVQDLFLNVLNKKNLPLFCDKITDIKKNNIKTGVIISCFLENFITLWLSIRH